MSYVLACVTQFNEGRPEVLLRARGRAISHAVDVAEILKKKFVTSAKYVDIRLSTEQLPNSDGKVSNVSSIEIEIAPK